jgi:HSP90 family molecular chaperone
MYIDTNEDGFEQEHVKAICSIGESSKANVSGYIGEKGIGFKSVFKVAKKVHIQSGPFSFSFTHTRSSDEDGLGMVTPYDEQHADLPSGVTTRFTLTPRDNSSFEQRVADVEALPQTFLLFLSKLRTITIDVVYPSGSPRRTSYSRSEAKGTNLTTIIKERTALFAATRTTQKFHVFTKRVENLPKEATRPDIQSADVVLAFPLDHNDVPLENHQYTYAYLPLRNLGFKVRFLASGFC